MRPPGSPAAAPPATAHRAAPPADATVDDPIRPQGSCGLAIIGDRAWLTLTGSHDLASVHELRHALGAAACAVCEGRVREVHVELSGVDTIDSRSLAALTDARRVIAHNGGWLTADAGTGPVTQLLQLTGVSDLPPSPVP